VGWTEELKGGYELGMQRFREWLSSTNCMRVAALLFVGGMSCAVEDASYRQGTSGGSSNPGAVAGNAGTGGTSGSTGVGGSAGVVDGSCSFQVNSCRDGTVYFGSVCHQDIFVCPNGCGGVTSSSSGPWQALCAGGAGGASNVGGGGFGGGGSGGALITECGVPAESMCWQPDAGVDASAVDSG
jgi:hypothetical protein